MFMSSRSSGSSLTNNIFAGTTDPAPAFACAEGSRYADAATYWRGSIGARNVAPTWCMRPETCVHQRTTPLDMTWRPMTFKSPIVHLVPGCTNPAVRKHTPPADRFRVYAFTFVALPPG